MSRAFAMHDSLLRHFVYTVLGLASLNQQFGATVVKVYESHDEK